MFGGSQTPFGSPGFGQNSTPAFGTPAPAPFGAAPATGGFGGSTTFGSSAPSGGAFGGGGFGSTPAPAFGSTPAPAFGAPAPATGFGAPAPGAFGAPATSSPFGAPAPATGGLFGSTPAPAPGGLFGSSPAPAFGAPAPSTGFGGAPAPAFGASSTPAFGAPAPATGGLFGSTPAPATGGLFGSAPAPATGGFGSTTGGFGAPAPAFGAPAPATGGMFGAPAPAFGAPAAPGGGGTKIAPFQPLSRPDGGSQITLHSISAMQQYNTKSHEELRFEDYSQGNKGTGTSGGAFGAPSPGGFGAPAPATGGLFGAPAPATGAFGAPAPATGGLFGAPAPSAFGAPAAPSFGAPAPATGAFGAPAPATGGLFGAPAPAPSTGFGGFGTPAPAPAFGAPAPATGGLFGAPAPAPSTGFGGFGTPAPAPSGGLFGAPAPAPSGGLFGAPAPAPSGGLFGGTPAPAPGGLFGTPAPAPAFGAAPAPAFGASTGAFGAPAPSTGLFGSTPAPAPSTGGLFGAPAPAPATGGLFGAPAPTPGGLFGAPAAAPVAQPPQVAAYSAPALGAVMPPAANEIMASQLAALESKRKEMEQNDNFRSKPEDSSSVTALTLSARDSKKNTLGPVAPSRISTYRASPISNAKFRPRGFVSPSSDGTSMSLSKLGKGGKPMAAPETVAASSASRLIFAPSPKPKLKLLLGDKKTTDPSKEATPKASLGSLQQSSKIPPATPMNGGKTSLTNGASETPQSEEVNRAQKYYQDVIASPETKPLKESMVPILTRDGYTCNPPLSELEQMDAGDLAAVANFSVTRKGVGKVAWEGAVDVRSANLDKIIVIDPKSVSVYSEEEELGKKPDVGTKLNRPAILTLEGVFPPDPSNAEKFAKKVKRQTEKMDAELIQYDPSSGEWILRVKHFSRYALDDDSDDDENEDVDATGRSTEVSMEDVRGKKVDFRLGEREGRSPGSIKDGSKGMNRQDTPYKTNTVLVLDEDETMEVSGSMSEASMVEEAETAFTKMQSSLEAESRAQAMKKKLEKESALFPEEGASLVHDANQGKRYIPDDDDFYEASLMPSFLPKIGVSVNKSSSTDFGLRMARSFRVGWSPDGSFLALGKGGVLVKKRPKIESLNRPGELKILEAHRSHAQKISTEGPCPLFSLPSNSKGAIKDTLESYSKVVQGNGGKDSLLDSPYSLLKVLHETKMAEDASAISTFGVASKPANHAIDDQNMLSITQWFIDSCSDDVMTEITNARTRREKYGALIAAVSGGDLAQAAKIAEEENLFQLSILLSSGPEARKDIFQEIMSWKQNGSADRMATNLSRTYRLAAGDLGKEEDIYKYSRNDSNSPNWQQRMIMKLKYTKPENACKSLSLAIAQYESDVARGVTPFPSANDSDRIENTLFRLLKLGTKSQPPLSNVIDPLGYTKDRNNFSLSFHLASCVHSIFDAVALSPEEEHILLNGYAYQLQSMGHWEWAVYVFLCVLSEKTELSASWRYENVRSLLLHNYFGSDGEPLKKRQFLENLGVPSTWFEEVLSYRSLVLGDEYGYITHKMNFDLQEGTKVLEKISVPNMLFCKKQERDDLFPLFEGLFENVDNKSLLAAATQFFAIRQEIEELEHCSQEEIEDAAPTLLDACNDIEQVFSSYKASNEKVLHDALEIVPETYLVPMGSFLAEALHQTSHFKLQIFALREGLGIKNTASQMMKLMNSEASSEYSIYKRENICRWLM